MVYNNLNFSLYIEVHWRCSELKNLTFSFVCILRKKTQHPAAFLGDTGVFLNKYDLLNCLRYSNQTYLKNRKKADYNPNPN